MHKHLQICFVLLLLVRITTAQNTSSQIDSLVTLADAEPNLEGKIKFLLQAESRSADCLPCKAQCHAQLGLLYCEAGHYEAGYNYLLSAIQLRRQLGDSLRVAGNFANMAMFKREEGHYAQAIDYATTALLILEELQQKNAAQGFADTLVTQNLAAVCNNLSNIHSDFGNNQEGLKYALKYLKTSQLLGDQVEIQGAYYTLANRYFVLHQDTKRPSDADSADLLYRRFLQFAENHPGNFEPFEIPYTYHNLASLAISRSDYTAAKALIVQAEQLYLDEADPAGLIDVEILKANAAIGEQQDYRTAMGNLRQVQKLMVETAVDTSVQLEIYNLLSECFEALGQVDSALLYSRMAEKLHQQLFNSQQNRFNDIDRANLEKRNELQRTLSALEIAKGKDRQRQWASLAAILGLLISIGALIWRQREQKQRTRIAQQNQAIEDTLKDAQVRFLQGIIEGQQIERQETKDMLHNDIANTVLSLSYDIENTQPQHPAQKNWAAELQKLAAHTRKLSHQKGGLIHDVGLYDGIQDLIRRVGKTNLIEVEFVSNLDKKRLDISTEVEIWHMVQEMISNTLKYARATRIELSIEADERSVFIMYHDNGVGFDYEAMLSRKKSLGLQSLIEKTHGLGGQTPEIITAPGHGLTISIEIPSHKPELP